MATIKKGFHKCDLCPMKITDKDPHRSCVRCLGLQHDPEQCALCQQMQPQSLKLRRWRLQEFLGMEEDSQRKERKERASSVPPVVEGLKIGKVGKAPRSPDSQRSSASAPKERPSMGKRLLDEGEAPLFFPSEGKLPKKSRSKALDIEAPTMLERKKKPQVAVSMSTALQHEARAGVERSESPLVVDVPDRTSSRVEGRASTEDECRTLPASHERRGLERSASDIVGRVVERRTSTTVESRDAGKMGGTSLERTPSSVEPRASRNAR